MFTLDGRLYSFAEGQDRQLRFWDDTKQAWAVDARPIPHRMRVGKGILTFDNGAEYEGTTVLAKPADGSYHNFYYAQGRLFFYHTHTVGDARYTRVCSCPWTSQDGKWLGETRIESKSNAALKSAKLAWGHGLFGPFAGRILESRAEWR